MNMFKQMSTIMTMHGKQVCDQHDQCDLVQFSDSGVSPFNGLQFHYFLVNWGKLGVLMCIIKFSTQQHDGIYDMTNNLKIIISVRRGGNLLFWSVYIDSTALC